MSSDARPDLVEVPRELVNRSVLALCNWLYWSRDSAVELAKLLAEMPGYTQDQYAAAIRQAWTQSERGYKGSVDSRRLVVDRAASEDVANAVFMLYVHNTNPAAEHDAGLYNLPRFGDVEILRPRASEREVQTARDRAAQAFHRAAELGWAADAADRLVQEFPELNKTNLSAALNHGWVTNR